jgi:dTDP-4-dehydrorhamnose reductase
MKGTPMATHENAGDRINRENKVRILIVGATGMLGSQLLCTLSANSEYDVFGTIRHQDQAKLFSAPLRGKLISDVQLGDVRSLLKALSPVQPDLVINCAGVIKQKAQSLDPIESIMLNALLPHVLADFTRLIGARLIHFSTDCVFVGSKGQYVEGDPADAQDIYGRTKLLGELHRENCLTIRTSIVGHELTSASSLIEWFLSQTGSVNGYTRAIFSGLPTVEIARILQEFIIPDQSLYGLYHLSGDGISKHDLLQIVADVYGKNVRIEPDDKLQIDRSLNSDRFRQATSYSPRSWRTLIESMRDDFLSFRSSCFASSVASDEDV